MTTHRITDEQSRSALRYAIAKHSLPFTATLTEGAKRGLSQNGLFHAWMGQIANHRGDMTAGGIKAECHIKWGIPLLRAEDPLYNDLIERALGGRPYAEVMEILERGLVPCSSYMTTAQMSQYMEAVWREWAPQVRLMDPEELKVEERSMTRREFTVATKSAALDRANGVCECGCGQPLADRRDPKSKPEYDHIIEAYLGGDNSLENCCVIRFDCHKVKSRKRAPNLAKVRREDKRRKGLTATKRKMPYRRFDGTSVWPK